MISLRKVCKELNLDQSDVKNLCDQLDVKVRFKRGTRWRFLRNCDYQLINDAIGLIEKGILQQSGITRETVRRIMRNRKRKERREEKEFMEAVRMMKGITRNIRRMRRYENRL